MVDTVGSGEGADGWGDGVVAVGGFGFGFRFGFGFGLGSGFGLVCGAGVDCADEKCGFGVGEFALGAGCGESARVVAGTVRDANCAVATVDDG